MLTPTEILAGLARVSNDASRVAIAWHFLLFGVAVALVTGWRPSRRLAAALLALPLASVSALAFAYRNPFNGGAFALLAVLLCALAPAAGRDPVSEGPAWARALAWPVLATGWLYPHFLDESRGQLAYLYAAPTGLIPCPTLLLLVGLLLLAGGLRSRAVSLTVAAAGLLYGLLGALWLGVVLDLVLVAGAAALAALALRRRHALAPAGVG